MPTFSLEGSKAACTMFEMANHNRLLLTPLLLIGVVFSTGRLVAQSPTDGLALRGTLVTPGGIVEKGVVLIRQGKIVAAGAKVKIPGNVTAMDVDGIIAPGLIDLHNHLTWNVFPRWHPNQEFGSRY